MKYHGVSEFVYTYSTWCIVECPVSDFATDQNCPNCNANDEDTKFFFFLRILLMIVVPGFSTRCGVTSFPLSTHIGTGIELQTHEHISQMHHNASVHFYKSWNGRPNSLNWAGALYSISTLNNSDTFPNILTKLRSSIFGRRGNCANLPPATPVLLLLLIIIRWSEDYLRITSCVSSNFYLFIYLLGDTKTTFGSPTVFLRIFYFFFFFFFFFFPPNFVRRFSH